MCWMLGALENQRLTSSQQHCPSPGHPELVVTAKPSAMETIVQPQEQEAGQPPSARCLCAPLPCPCYAVVLGVGSLWTQKRCFCWEACKLAPPFHAKRPAQRAHVPPVPAAAFQLPGPPEDSVPGSAGGRQGTPVNGRRAGPGFLCQQHSVCAPRPRQGSPGPASGASLLLWFQAFLGAENRNQPCVFQAARLLRNSCLSLRTETAFCPPLAPFREGDTCRFQGGFLFCAD